MLKKYQLKIEQDHDDMNSPDTWEDYSVFLVAFHRDFWVERKGFGKEICQAVMNEEWSDEEQRIEAEEIRDNYYVFGLEAYIHSGVVLALSQEGNFPDRRWDVSQLGVVFVAKSEGKTKPEARKMAQGLIETWNMYLAGDVWMYTIEDEKGEVVDVSSGFFGREAAEEAGHETLKELRDREQAKHLQKVKAQIKNRVPLEKRI